MSFMTPGAAPSHQSGTACLLDYEQVATLLGCTPRLVRKLVETRKLDSVKVNRLVRIEPEAVERFIAANRREAVPTPSVRLPERARS